MENKIKAIIYARVSTKEQEETGYSLPSQEKLLKEYSDKKSFVIDKIFSVSESASGKKLRETFSQMMIYVKKNNINIIVCEKADRISRNFRDMVMIDDWLEKDENRQIHLVKDGLALHKNSRSQEKLNWGIRMLFAKNYIDNLSEEVKKGQKEKILQGWLPTTPPVGYKTVGEKGHKIHIIDPEKAPSVIKMFQLYATGNYSLEKLTEMMNLDGLKNTIGKKISKAQIHAQFSNPFYIGKIVWNEKIYQGKHEPIISIELWNKVQDVLHKKGTPKYSKHNFLFRGLFQCDECGGVIAWERQKGNWYGHCNHYRPCEQREYYRSEEIQDQLLEKVKLITPKSQQLINWVIKALKEGHKEEIEYHNSFVDELNKRITTAKNRLDKIYEDKIDEKITEAKYNELREKYVKEEQEALDTLAKHKRANANYYDYGLLVLNVTKRALEILQDKEKPDNRKREYYKVIFSDLRIRGKEVQIEFNLAFRLLADFNSKIEKYGIIKENIFELPINCLPNEKTGSLEPAHSVLLHQLELIRTELGEYKSYYTLDYLFQKS